MPYVFDEQLGRRRFIAAAAVAGTGLALGACGGAGATFGAQARALPTSEAGHAQWGRDAGTWVPSCCNMCGGQSGILVHVVDGVVREIEPNHWNPNNYSNLSSDFFSGYSEAHGCAEGGALCAKGHAGIATLYDPDRVRTPLRRRNPDKRPGADPQWEEVTWDRALDEIAASMAALRNAGEAHRLAWISEDHSFTHVQGDFCNLYGTPNYGMHSNLCDVARKASFKTVCGHDRPLTDFLQSRYILLFGWNPTSAIKWVYLPRILTRAIERGARLVVVDPYLSDTAAKAHEWVSLRPGTDGALALALAHVLIRDGLHDREFVARWTSGFDAFSTYVADKTPAWAEEITGVRRATIERIAHELGTTRPACIDVWSGPGQHSNGVQGGRAIAALSALLGAYDRPGTLIIPDKRGNKHAAVAPDEVARASLARPRLDELHRYPLGHGSGVYTKLFQNLADGTGPYQAGMFVCVFQNPMMSVPGSDTVARAIARVPTVVIDTMLSETAMLADWVLPGTTYFERYDLNTHWVTWPVVALRQPVIAPRFGQPAEYEVVAALGRRLGLRDAKGRDFFRIGAVSGQPIESLTAWYEEFLSNELLTGAPKISLAQLKALPGAVWVDRGGTRYEKHAEPVPSAKLAGAWFDGDSQIDGTLVYDKPKTSGGKRIGVVLDGKVVAGFPTPSGRIELVAPSLASLVDARGTPVDPLPVFVPRDWQPSSEYPLYLINWKEASHTHARTQNNPLLLELKADAPLVMHVDTAARLGLTDGCQVVVESPHGAVRARLHTTRRMHPDVVGLQHGFGHTALGRNARGRGTSDATLRPTTSDPISGMALHKEACVRVRLA